jgi:hypothetical protein
MPDLFQYLDFPSNSLNILLVVDLVFLEYLDCDLKKCKSKSTYFFSSEGVLAKLNLAKGALA